MATRWHVNPETMVPGKCTAQNRCNFAADGGQEPPHFGTQEEAQAVLDKNMSHLAVPSSLKKAPVPAKAPEPVVRLTKRKLEKLAIEEKALENKIAASRHQLRKLITDLDGLDLEFYDDAEMAGDEDNMNHYKNLEKDVLRTQKINERLGKEMTDFQNAYGKQLADFRSQNLTKKDFAQLFDERSEMNSNLEAKEVEYDEAYEMLITQEERIKEGDDDPTDPNVAHRLKMLNRDFEQAGIQHFRAKERVQHFADNYGQKMRKYEEKHGKYDVMKELEKALGL